MARVRSILSTVLVSTLLVACGGGDEDGGDEGDEMTDDTGSAESDTGTGGPTVYGPCDGSSVCFENYEDPSCIEPANDSAQGFCTEPCAAPGDCAVPPTGDPTIECLDLTGMGPVCVLLCTDASCPDGMVCRYVATGQGALDICFWPN
jgi:hypothetical protein